MPLNSNNPEIADTSKHEIGHLLSHLVESKAEIIQPILKNPALSDAQKTKWVKIVNRAFSPWPAWAIKCLIENVKLHCPTITDAEIRIFGQRINKFDFSELSKAEILIFSKILGHFSAMLSFLEQEAENKAHIREMEISFVKWVQQLIPWFNRLPLGVSQKYLEAFTKARGKTFDANMGSKGLKSNTLIYRVILFQWVKIEEFKSISELHAFLEKKMPSGTLGDKKRLEAICRVIGLKYRSRGRPRKILRRILDT